MGSEFVDFSMGEDSFRVPKIYLSHREDFNGGEQATVTLDFTLSDKDDCSDECLAKWNFNVRVMLYKEYILPLDKLESLKNRFSDDLEYKVERFGEHVYTLPYLDLKQIFIENEGYPLFLTCPKGSGDLVKGGCHIYSSRNSGQVHYSFFIKAYEPVSLGDLPQIDELILYNIEKLKRK